MHVGSIYSVMPPSYVRADGNRVEANPSQAEIYGHWAELCKEWRRPDILLCNGDIIDGVQPANQGVETWTTSLDEQLDAATVLLKMLEPREAYFTTGTSYHVASAGRRHEETLAGNFGARLDNDVFIDFNGHVIHAAHHISYSKVFHYRTTPLARAMLISKLNEEKSYKCEWLARSHVHYFVQIRFSSHGALTTPCWEGRTPYMVKGSPEDMPDIGAVRLLDEGDGMLSLELKEWKPPRPRLIRVGSGSRKRKGARGVRGGARVG